VDRKLRSTLPGTVFYRLPPLGIRAKLVLLSVLILASVSFGFAALQLALSGSLIEEDLRERAVAFGQEIAATIGDRREFESGALLAHQIARILEVRANVLQLDILAFTDKGTTVVATSDVRRRLPFTRKEVGQVADGAVVSRLVRSAGQRRWEVMAPVTLEGRVAGAVGVEFSLNRADAVGAKVRRWALASTAISIVVMATLTSVAVWFVVSRPMRRFMDAIDRVKAGDTSATVPAERDDEFGLLADHFNAMMTRINSFSGELKAQVDAATAELDRRYRELQRLNAQLFRLQQDLSHAERLALAGRIMAEVAHEVGTPLHSIAGHLELLQADLPESVRSGDIARRLSTIDTQLARVTEIIARLMDLTRRAPGEPGRIDVSRLVHETVTAIEPAVANAGIALDVSTVPDLPAVLGHPSQLQQVMVNLLTNAMKATPRDGRVRVSTSQVSDRDVCIEVSDTGCGIPAAHRKLIFEPFFSTGAEGGTGLGLFVSSNIVQQHRGRIEVESEEGRGSTFRVTLPIESAP
jgi:two-component system, NtrC family, sensor histidine kinase HydH